jgi:hypothetical protein
VIVSTPPESFGLFDKQTREFIALGHRRRRAEGDDTMRRIYSGPLASGETLDFYTDGHPHVERMLVATYELVKIEEVECNRDPERIDTWTERNNRIRL